MGLALLSSSLYWDKTVPHIDQSQPIQTMVLRILGVLILFNASTAVLWYDVSLSSSHQRGIFILKINASVVQWVFVFHWSIREQFSIVNAQYLWKYSLTGGAEPSSMSALLSSDCMLAVVVSGPEETQNPGLDNLSVCVGGSEEFLASKVLTIS